MVIGAADFHGWPAVVLRNSSVEAVVVPAIGRIMALRLLAAGGPAGDNPIWSPPAIGPSLASDDNGWINYGGDKAWPAPQADWPALVGHGWPPPATFDARPYDVTTSADGASVRMTSPVDPAYGVRVRRTLSLDPVRPVLIVETAYEKLRGAPITVGVWTITQLAAPDRLFARLPARSRFPNGFVDRMPAPARDAHAEGRLLSLARDTGQKTMIGTDAEALLWVGPRLDVLIEAVPPAPPAADARWPGDARAQIYTSPDAAGPYVELELLSPLAALRVGATATFIGRYTLVRRTSADPIAEARAVLGL